MGVLDRGIKSLRNERVALPRIHLGLFALIAFLVVFMAGADCSWALQKHTLTPVESEEARPAAGLSQQQKPSSGSHGVSQEHSVAAVQHSPQPDPQGSHNVAEPVEKPHGAAPGLGTPKAREPQLPATPTPGHPKAGGHGPEELGPGAVLEHEEEHVEHGPPLPELSPIPGVTFVETMIGLMEHELRGRTLGWRPNDIVFGRLTDNINSYQLGVLEAMRFTTLRLKDSLTRMGDADSYDPDLELALNLFMNRATLFWFPSAENAYGEAIDHLKKFRDKLKSGQRNFYYRVDNLLALLNTYKDLIGNVNKSLVRPMGWFESDDYFYYAKGVAHVYYEILRVVRVGYEKQLSSTLNALDIMDEIIHELHRAEEMEPWIILNSDLDGLLANHRANLNGPLSEVAHMLVVISHF